MAVRKCRDWLATFMEYTKLLESPDSFLLWTGVACVSAALRRQVWVDFGYFKIYPSVYITLVSPPGKCRKNAAISAGRDIVEEVSSIKVFSGVITREALAKELRESETAITLPDGTLYLHCSLAVFAEELLVFLDEKRPELIEWLIDFYDCKKYWEYKTKNKGSDKLMNVFMTMIGGATPQKLGSKTVMDAIGGGLASRIIFVVEDNVRQRNPMPTLTEYELTLKSNLVHDLNEVASLKGRMVMSDECFEFYKDWYVSMKPSITDDRVASYYERKHVHAIKLAMIVSASRNSSMVIDIDDFRTALAMLDSVEPNMVNAFGATGRSALTPDVAMVLKVISDRGEITRRELFRLVWRDVDPRFFDDVINALTVMGYIVQDRDASGATVYKMRNKQ